MKAVWNIISVVAIANLLALAGFVGWLRMSDRLNSERVQKVREVLKPTLAAEKKQAEDEAKASELAVAERAEAERLARPPVPAADQVENTRADEETRAQTARRRETEIAQLRASLVLQKRELEEREQRLAQDRARFEAERTAIAATEGAVQFKSALSTLEAQKPADAKAVLGTMWSSGLGDQVLSYLSRMDEGKRGKVMAEFVKEDPRLAAELLERLRTRGVEVSRSAPAASPPPAAAQATAAP